MEKRKLFCLLHQDLSTVIDHAKADKLNVKSQSKGSGVVMASGMHNVNS